MPRSRVRRELMHKRLPLVEEYLMQLGGYVIWPMQETSGTTMIARSDVTGTYNGTYTNVTVGQTTGLRGIRYGGTFNGTTSYGNIYSASLNSFFDPALGTALIFCKVSAAGVWTDGTARLYYRLVADPGGATDLIDFRKDAANGSLSFLYRAGGTNNIVTKTSVSYTDYFMAALTWNKAGDTIEAFLNGVSIGTDTGLGVWAGNLQNNKTTIGAGDTTPNNVWSGDHAMAALFNHVLSDDEISYISALAGIS